jgi:gliding motility-associated-like protein
MFQKGSVWNKNMINLENAFSYQFKIFLGCDTSGADGLTFALQADSTALGYEGAGMGFHGIDSSIAVVIDTYQNDEQNDPPYDHVTIMSNGDVYHLSADNLAGPVMALSNSPNIKDCKWHLLKVEWQPLDSTLKVSIDSVLRLTLQKDIIHSVFNDHPIVYWGFTAGTGYIGNVQEMCTFNNAYFHGSPQTPTPICGSGAFNFTDSSVSFGSITNWFWNFDDGSTSTQQNTQHAFSSPGIYNVTLNVTGNDGCVSDTASQQVVINANPQANFTDSIKAYCTGGNVTFTDSSNFNGAIPKQWFWDFGNGDTTSLQNSSVEYYSPGTYTVHLNVETDSGCVDSIQKQINILKTPPLDFAGTDGCKNTPFVFDAQATKNKTGITTWIWDFDDGSVSQGPLVSHTFKQAGTYNVQLHGITANGCSSDTASQLINVYDVIANAGNDTTVLYGNPYQMQATGGVSYIWSPSQGLSNPGIANPIATLYNDITYFLTVTTDKGCSAKDTLNIKVVKGPEIYAPTAFTPNGDGKNDRYSIFPVGITDLMAFKIFSRWGQVLYSSLNTKEGWDGNVNGIPQPAGTYVWIAIGKTFEGKILKRQGTFLLIR